jgi:hypothetical protein
MKAIVIILMLFVSVGVFGQMQKMSTLQSERTRVQITNTNIDSLDRRITTLVDSGTVVETIDFRDVEYDTVNSSLGYIIFSADSIWCERPRGIFRRRLDE